MLAREKLVDVKNCYMCKAAYRLGISYVWIALD